MIHSDNGAQSEGCKVKVGCNIVNNYQGGGEITWSIYLFLRPI